MMQRPFIIVTGVQSQISQSPQLDGDQWIEGGEGARGRMDHFAILDFEGKPNNLMTSNVLEHKVVALTMSDLVLLHSRTAKLIDQGIAMNVLDLSDYTGAEGRWRR